MASVAKRRAIGLVGATLLMAFAAFVMSAALLALTFYHRGDLHPGELDVVVFDSGVPADIVLAGGRDPAESLLFTVKPCWCRFDRYPLHPSLAEPWQMIVRDPATHQDLGSAQLDSRFAASGGGRIVYVDISCRGARLYPPSEADRAGTPHNC